MKNISIIAETGKMIGTSKRLSFSAIITHKELLKILIATQSEAQLKRLLTKINKKYKSALPKTE